MAIPKGPDATVGLPRGGLEDRVFRIRTERSSATSLPGPRTSRNISNVEILEQAGGLVKLRFNWVA